MQLILKVLIYLCVADEYCIEQSKQCMEPYFEQFGNERIKPEVEFEVFKKCFILDDYSKMIQDLE